MSTLTETAKQNFNDVIQLTPANHLPTVLRDQICSLNEQETQYPILNTLVGEYGEQVIPMIEQGRLCVMEHVNSERYPSEHSEFTIPYDDRNERLVSQIDKGQLLYKRHLVSCDNIQSGGLYHIEKVTLAVDLETAQDLNIQRPLRIPFISALMNKLVPSKKLYEMLADSTPQSRVLEAAPL